MANGLDPMQLIGLALEKRRREEESARDMAFQQERTRAQALQGALALAKETGDPKLATGMLEALGGGMSRQQDWDLVDSVAKHVSKQQKEKAATPNTYAQYDLARGVAAQLDQPGDPRLAALAALRTLEGVPEPYGTQLAIRGGALVGENRRKASEREAQMLQRDALVRSRAQERAESPKQSSASKRKEEDRAIESDEAWSSFVSSDLPWDEWKKDAKKSDIIAAARHPAFKTMKSKFLQRPMPVIPMRVPGSPVSAPEEPGSTKKKIVTPAGWTIEEE